MKLCPNGRLIRFLYSEAIEIQSENQGNETILATRIQTKML